MALWCLPKVAKSTDCLTIQALRSRMVLTRRALAPVPATCDGNTREGAVEGQAGRLQR